MLLLNLLCSVCADLFRNDEDIYSTSCGHVFHLRCMREWQCQSSSCPQCHEFNPTSHKLYLCFDESNASFTKQLNELEASSKEVEIIKSKLFEATLKSVNYRVQSEQEMADLKKVIINLKEKIICFEGSTFKQRQQILKLTQEISSLGVLHETTMAELEKENDILKQNLESMAIELAIEVSKKVTSSESCTHQGEEISLPQPSSSGEKTSNGTTDNACGQIFVNKNNMEDKSLQHISTEFEEKVTENAQSKIDKLRLQNSKECRNEFYSSNRQRADTKSTFQDINGQLLKNNITPSSEHMKVRQGTNSSATTCIDDIKDQVPSRKNFEELSTVGNTNGLSSKGELSNVHNIKHVSDVKPLNERNDPNTSSATCTKGKKNQNKIEQNVDVRQTDNKLNEKSSNLNDIKNETDVTSSTETYNSSLRVMEDDTTCKSSNFLGSTQQKNTKQFEDSAANSIVIQNYPMEKLIYPLEYTIIRLAMTVDLTLKAQDIDKVYVVGQNYFSQVETVSLFVRFKTTAIKSKFLATKSRLSRFFQTITLKAYVDEGSIEVFFYAKKKLLHNGFNDIYWSNNKIFARMDKTNYKTVRIFTCLQVDNILKTPPSKDNN